MMERTVRIVVGVLVCALLALPVLAQNPTGTLSGRVMYSSDPLPGVAVRILSPALQGERTAVTTDNGDFMFPYLPPGTYTATFNLDGFKEQTLEVKISAAQARVLDVQMYQESFAEEIQVTGAYETISAGSEASSTYEQNLIEKLAVARNNLQAAYLTPGASDTGPSANQVVIAGAHAYDSLFLINGVVVNENIRAQALPLYIEDAIQETTTSVSGISAEYGRFQGGVINTITKSGGNEFSGSLRVNFENDAWISKNYDLAPDRVDDINQIYEATVGGYVLKDALWFFFAGRSRETSGSDQTRYTLLPFSTTTDEKRYEGKLTWSLTPNHRFIGSYIKIDQARTNTFFGTIMDYASLNPNRKDPQDIWSVNYTGVFSEKFFGEAQYSKRFYGIGQGSGSPYTDIEGGTLLLDRSRGSARYHTPTFCSAPSCKNEERNNEDLILKASLFLSSEATGSHDIAFGYDSFNDIRIQDNHQQGSDFRIYGSSSLIRDGYIYPIFANRTNLPPGETSLPSNRRTYSVWTPIFALPEGTDFITDSLFVNDTWRLNQSWSFNLGVRYDKNDGTDSSGNKVADDSRFSPRLGATWDPKGDGDLLFHLNYAHYVTGITQGIANDAGAGGQPGWVQMYYDGPCINCEAWDPVTNMANPDYTGPLVSQEEAIAMWYEWFLANGGTSALPGVYYAELPGFTPVIRGSLKSPYTEEYAIGVTKRLGSRGIVRTDYVHREGHDFYVDRTAPGDQVDTGIAGVLDVLVISNDDSVYSRKYDGLHTSFQYRLGDRWNLGATWAWSHALGNLDGETSSSGPVTGDLTAYAEYKQARWYEPYGDLNVDQRNKVRAWVVWDAIATSHHNLSVSLMQSYWSGTGYSAAASVDVGSYVTNPGYATPPEDATYYFSGRNEYKWDDVYRTDLSINYSFFLPLFGSDVELFIQPEVLNLFNGSAQTAGSTTINLLETFNPFTETPQEGVNWEKSSSFGTPRSEADFQTPRTFRFSVGVRF